MGFSPVVFVMRKASGKWTVYPPSNTSGEDLAIQPNAVNTRPLILFNGNSSLGIYLYGGSVMEIFDSSTSAFKIGYATPDVVLESVIASKNIYLKTNGGKVKFGTHSATCGEALSGYIEILDSGGTTRKLGVIS